MFLFQFSDETQFARDELTRSSLAHVFRRDGKHIQHFGHNLRHYIRYRRGRWDFCMGLEAAEEGFDPVEEFDKRFAACDGILCRLRDL
jgi:hypothetical protein